MSRGRSDSGVWLRWCTGVWYFSQLFQRWAFVGQLSTGDSKSFEPLIPTSLALLASVIALLLCPSSKLLLGVEASKRAQILFTWKIVIGRWMELLSYHQGEKILSICSLFCWLWLKGKRLQLGLNELNLQSGTMFPPAVDRVWDPWPSLSRGESKEELSGQDTEAYPLLKYLAPICFLLCPYTLV